MPALKKRFMLDYLLTGLKGDLRADVGKWLIGLSKQKLVDLYYQTRINRLRGEK